MKVVGTARFERATPASRTLCSTRLSHVPTKLSLVCYLFGIVNLKSHSTATLLVLLAVGIAGFLHRVVCLKEKGFSAQWSGFFPLRPI